MGPIDIKHLLKKYKSGICTPEELELLENWYLKWKIGEEKVDIDKIERAKEDVWRAIICENRKVRRFSRWTQVAAAASIVFAIIAGAIFLQQKTPKKSVQFAQIIQNIQPGGDKAMLTLSDGRTIVLDNEKNGILAQQENINITKLNDGQLAYNDKGNNNILAQQKLNTLTTPRGGQYQVTLSDSTKVWLNSGSSITFPTFFRGKERRVEVKGEVYFEVAKNAKMPFIVNVNNKAEVKVLGTNFNVSAYEDEGTINTTLVEGSVQISSFINNQTATITPGQQAKIDLQGKIELADVDTREYSLWKEGWFYFNEQNLDVILTKLARWYDFSYNIEDQAKLQQFSMKVRRFEEFTTIVEILEKTGMVHFDYDGKKISITK